MPTYEYECTKCGKVVELFQSITEPARRRLRKKDPKPCDCQAPVIRLIGTGAGIIFKGSGFYETDYRSESYKKAAKADREAGGNGKDKSTAKDGDKKTADTAVSKDTGTTDKKDSGSTGGKTAKSPKKETASAPGTH